MRLFKLLTVFSLIFLLATSSYARDGDGSTLENSGVISIITEDGSVDTFPFQIKVTNGALIDNGDGTVSLDISGTGDPDQNLFETHDTPQGTDPVADSTTDTLQWLEGEGIDITGDSSADSITIAGEDASTTNKGIASFDSTDFSTSSGNVTIDDDGHLHTSSSLTEEWTDTGTILHPTDSTVDEIVIGGTTEAGADIFLGVDGAAYFNKQGNSVDFNIDGGTITSLFQVDGSDDDVEINGGLNVNLPAGDSIVIDAATNNRTIDTGSLQIDQTPSIENTRAITINLDINSQATSHAQVANIITTALADGETATAYDVNIDTSTSTGGIVRGYEMSIAGAGTAVGHLMHADPGIFPLSQFSGTFINVEQAWHENGGFSDVTIAFNSTANDVSIFTVNSAKVYIGMDDAFNQIRVNLDTFAGGAGIKPVFEYSSGGGTPVWTVFTPQDETQGFRQTGVINWNIDDLVTPTWAVATVSGTSKRYIRITRTQASIPTDPIEDTIQIAVTIDYFWNADGKIFVGSVTTGKSSNTVTTEGNTEISQMIAHIDDAFSETIEHTLMRHSDTAGLGAILYGIRSRGNHASQTAIQDDDMLFQLRVSGHDGTDFNDAASIIFDVDGSPGANDMPGRIEFWTTPDNSNSLAQRMTILSDGNVGIRTATPSEALEVTGDVKITDTTPHLEFEDSSAGEADFEFWADNDVFYATDLENSRTIWRYQANSNTFEFPTASVGINIGLGSPSDTLDVNGTANISGVLTLGDFTFPATKGTTDQILKLTASGALTFQADTGGAADQNLFETIAVSGQSDIVADTTTDTLTFAEGSNITITTNAGTDTITIAAAAGGATTELDNLGTVAVNTDIISDTDSTDDLGSATKAWAEIYTDDLIINTIDGNILIVGDGGGDYTTIDLACNAASPGDEIWVTEGTWTSFTLDDDNIKVIGKGAKEAIIVTVVAADLVIIGSRSGITIENMTLQITAATATTHNVISAANDSVSDYTTIKNCIINWTSATSLNGAKPVDITDGNTWFQNNIITSIQTNSTSTNSGIQSVSFALTGHDVYLIDNNFSIDNATTDAAARDLAFNMTGTSTTRFFVFGNTVIGETDGVTGHLIKAFEFNTGGTSYVIGNLIDIDATSTGTVQAIQVGNGTIVYINGNVIDVTTGDSDGEWLAVGTATVIANNNIITGDRKDSVGANTVLNQFVADDNGTAITVVMNKTTPDSGDTFIAFNDEDSEIGDISGTGSAGVIAYNTFLGSHYTQIDLLPNEVLEVGMVLEMTGQLMANSTNLAQTRVCKTVASTKVYGVYGGTKNDDKSLKIGKGKKPSKAIREKIRQAQGKENKKPDEILDNEYKIHLSLGLGAGYVLVSDKNGDIEAGDLLESDGNGYAQKQSDTIIKSSTIGKAIENVIWSNESDTKKLIGCLLYVG